MTAGSVRPQPLLGRRIVILGPPESFVTRFHARVLSELGLRVDVVTWSAGTETELAPGIAIHRASLPRRQLRGLLQTILRKVQRVGQTLYQPWYRQQTGKSQIDSWDQDLIYPYLMRGPLIRLANTLHPDWLFAEEASSYGLATTLFKGPRIIFPFGGDIYCAAETWPMARYWVGKALRQASAVIPASAAAAEHLQLRFRVSRAEALYSGLELERYARPEGEAMEARRKHWAIPTESIVLANCRRFRPQWGGEIARQAFLEIARQDPRVHCLLLRGGDQADDLIRRTRAEVQALGLERQFTFIERDLTADEYCEVATIADVFVSLMNISDMRSQSVMEFSAGGGVPVIGRLREYELMVEQGFAAALPPLDDVPATIQAIQSLVNDPHRRTAMRRQNDAFQQEHNNRVHFLDRLEQLLIYLLPSPRP